MRLAPTPLIAAPLIAALLIGVLAVPPAPPAAAQAPPQGQTGADQAIDARLRLVTDRLRQSASRAADPAGTDWESMRAAVDRAQAMLADLPVESGQAGTLARARSALADAHAALEADRPDRARVAEELREAAEVVAALRPGLGTIAPTRQ